MCFLFIVYFPLQCKLHERGDLFQEACLPCQTVYPSAYKAFLYIVDTQ